MPMRNESTLAIIVVLLSHAQIFAADWPQWRGPNRNGIWPEDGIVERFDDARLPIRWRAEIGSGYSGPTVAAGRVYVTDRLTKPAPVERVHCFDAATGEGIWSHSYRCQYEKVGYRAGPRASVTIERGTAYSLGTMGDLFCFNAANGKPLWKKHLRSDYKIKMPIWGIAASPIIERDLLILQIGGADNACIVALDKTSGQERWRALNDRASYSAPIIIEQAGTRVLVCWTGVHWKHPFTPSRMVIGIATPVFRDGYLFVSGFYDGSLLLKVNPHELAVEKVWRRKGPNEKETDSLHCCISTPVLLGEHIYGVDSYGQFRCLDLLTGDRLWVSHDPVPGARWANIHMVQNNERIWMFNERGDLIIPKLSPNGFQEISRSNPTFAVRHLNRSF